MNGRVYDPNLGRFLSVDPVFEFPTNTQSLNPYSYVLNNPLSLTDPSGYCAVTSADEDKNNTTVCNPNGGNNTDGAQTGSHIHGVQTGIKGSDVNFLVGQRATKNAFWMGVLGGNNPLGNGNNTSQGARDSLDKPLDIAGIGGVEQVSKKGSIPVEDVFYHLIANDDGSNTPSPFDRQTNAALKLYLSSQVGQVVADYAITHDVKIGISEMPIISRYRPDWGTGSDDVIQYSLNTRGYIAGMPASMASEFKGLTGMRLMSDLFAHEIAHTRIGSSALGKPYYRGSVVKWGEEFNAVRYGENPFRQYIGVPLRSTYTGRPIPYPLIVSPGE